VRKYTASTIPITAITAPATIKGNMLLLVFLLGLPDVAFVSCETDLVALPHLSQNAASFGISAPQYLQNIISFFIFVTTARF